LVDPVSLLLLLAATIFLGYLGSVLYKSTRVPDVIWLLLFGLLLGPILQVYDVSLFWKVAPLMSVIALTLILFGAGLSLNFYQTISLLPKTLLITIIKFVFSLILVGFFLGTFFPGFSLLDGLLLAAIVGGTDSAVIQALFKSFKRVEKGLESVEAVLLLESVINGVLCLVATITFIQMHLTPTFSITESLSKIATVFSTGLCVGAGIGLGWLVITRGGKLETFERVTTLAILFSCYACAEIVGGDGAGPVAALSFGLILGNASTMASIFRMSKRPTVDVAGLTKFNEELTFILRSFFFVLLGLITTVSSITLIFGTICVVLILIPRFITGKKLCKKLSFSEREGAIIAGVAPNGLTAAVAAQLPYVFDPAGKYLPQPQVFVNLACVVILETIVFSAIYTAILFRKR